MTASDVVNELRHAGQGDVLLIPFEDGTLVSLLSAVNRRTRILTKQDLAGRSLRELLRRLRAARASVSICSLHQSTVNRSVRMTEVFLLFTRSRYRFLRLRDGSFRRVTRCKSLLLLLPRLLLAGILGITSVVAVYLGALLARPAHRSRAASEQSDTILYVRADLPGPLRAGGSVSHVRGMMNAFRRAGYRVVYVADAPMPALDSEIEQILIRPWELLDVLDEFQLCFYNLQVAVRLRQLIRSARPAMIYQRHAVFHWASAWTARRLGIPIVLEANTSEVWTRQRWSRLIFARTAKACEAAAIRLSDCVAVISTGVREQLAGAGIRAARVIQNPNGVDPAEFHAMLDGSSIRDRYGLHDAIVVGFIGTFTRWHGVETLFDAATEVVRSNDRIQFLLIGDGDLRSQLQGRAQEKGIGHRLVFTGLVPHSEAPSHLAACDILVSPHLGFEKGEKFIGSPTKLFEYMATGKAIIASDLEQIGEVIRDGLNGRTMTAGDHHVLASLILELAGDEAQRKRLGMQAAHDVLANYTWDRNVDRIVASLQERNTNRP